VQNDFLSVTEAMPEDKYSFVPTAGMFKGARSFAEQIKHVACGNFAFFNEIEGKTPPEHCEKGGPSPAKTKAELVQYLKDSYAYANRVLATLNAQNAMQRVEGPYGGPNTRLGIATLAVWHISDHYGQIVEYLRMNGIVPPSTQQYGVPVR
jgi:uncharacterized damage-inducible protein DinB